MQHYTLVQQKIHLYEITFFVTVDLSSCHNFRLVFLI